MIANKKTRKGKVSLCGFLLKFSVIYDMMKKEKRRMVHVLQSLWSAIGGKRPFLL